MVDPAEMNRRWSRAIQESVEAKIGRALTQEESDKIWNTGSFMQLESLDRDFQHAGTATAVEEILASLPIREPLPPEYTRRD